MSKAHNILSTENVVDYYKKNRAALESIINDLIETINNKKDELFVYSIKSRLKTPYSCYLKTKRDQAIRSIEQITDLTGLRILCLFEQDIFKIHEFLLSLDIEKKIKIKKVKIFNWEENQFENLKLLTSKTYRRSKNKIHKTEQLNKDTGYKSIHYIIKMKHGSGNYYVEIQLRTLLQDVWGELEHKLCYKQGHIHSHIKKSFELLSRELQTNDSLLTNLKNIYDKQILLEKYSIKATTSPYTYFTYEDELSPRKIFKKVLKRNFDEYISFCEETFINPSKKKFKKAESMFKYLYKAIKSNNLDSNDKVNYFINMEEAFFHFLLKNEKGINKALEIYTGIINNKDYKHTTYIPYYRRGEIYFINSEIIEALEDFDQCEKVAMRTNKINPKNNYYIKVKLANLYWLLGLEFIDYTIKKIREAKKIFDENKELFDKHDEISLNNNLCWYYLEKYLVEKKNIIKEKNYKTALQYFKKLETFIKDFDCKNDYDTIAWFCYNTYLKNKDYSYLQKAEKYIKKALDAKINRTTSYVMSNNLIINHFQEIMSCASKLKRGTF